jgi:hypothetical protein
VDPGHPGLYQKTLVLKNKKKKKKKKKKKNELLLLHGPH